jgi:hypothetical protein
MDLASKEGQQVGIDLVLVGRRDALWRVGIVTLLRAFDEPGRLPRILDGNDLVASPRRTRVGTFACGEFERAG